MPVSTIPETKQQMFRPGRLAVAVCAMGLCMMSGAVIAAEWTRSASLNVGQIYTDNVELASENEKDDLITVVRPTVSASGEGARASVDVNAALEFNDLSGGSDNFVPLVNAQGNAELIENFFYTDVFARSNRVRTDPFRRSGDTALNEAENAETTYMYGISPYVQRRLGGFAEFQSRYRTDRQISADDGFDDSTQQEFNVSFVSGDDFTRLDWGLYGNTRTTDYSNNAGTGRGQDNDYSSADLRLGYRLNRQWRLTSSVGHEWREYDAETQDRDDNTWYAGFVWTPNSRTSLNVGYGDRYFENKPRFDLSWRKKRIELRAKYEHLLTDTRSVRGLNNDFSGTNPFGEPFDPVTGEPVPVSRNLTFQDAGLVSDERTEASIALQGMRTRIRLTGRHSEQTRGDTGEEAIFDDILLNANRRLSSKLSLNAGMTWEGDEDESGLTSDTLRYFLGLNRQLGARTSMAVNYSYAERDSQRPDDDFEENRIYVNFTFTL
jgi:uncharacterized protein (PEP-CTERM system associated)